MNEKLHGYDFWRKVLGSPKYVAAPMVDMSELSFRLLCRRYNSELCYTPMINSHQFLQDEVYRKQVFTTCSRDRPLIAQFCANDPDIFVKAGNMVAPYCDAIDLNLGCPQGIARKGHYGAFLQDDTDLIEELVSRAAKEFPIPVTCKIRILPGAAENTVKYVERLVKAGCSMVAIHGRNILQKGDETGLADWDVIKAVKERVEIPVLANGNILNFEDIKSCLEYTKADGIMSAEGILHNPALFTGKTPLVWEMAEEYLVLAEEHQTPSKIVRTHLFRLLQYSLEELQTMREDLAHASTIEEFRDICNNVKRALQSRVTTTNFDQNVIVNNAKNLNGLGLGVEKKIATIIDCCDKNSDVIMDANSDWIKTGMFRDDFLDEIITDLNEDKLVYHRDVLKEEITPYHLPIWLCHSRPRVPFNSETKKLKSEVEETENEDGLSKNDKRKQRVYESRAKGKKLKRKDEKIRRKEKIRLRMEGEEAARDNGSGGDGERITKRDKMALIRNRLMESRNGSLKVCVDLDFTNLMTLKEQQRLGSQLCRLYGSNRHSLKPLHLHFTNCVTTDPFYQLCCEKNEGFSNYIVDTSPKCPEELYPTMDIVYLSPDSPNVLQSLDMDKVYVIGGFVDDTVQKNVSLKKAESRGIETRRLPITEYLEKCSKGSFCQVLAVNQVFDILLHLYSSGDWVSSLLAGVPRRKGFVKAPTRES